MNEINKKMDKQEQKKKREKSKREKRNKMTCKDEKIFKK